MRENKYEFDGDLFGSGNEGICGDGDRKLVCTFDLTSSNAKTLMVMPKFGAREITATLMANYGMSGSSQDTDSKAYSENIECGGSESVKVEWIDWKSMFNVCEHFEAHGEQTVFCCKENKNKIVGRYLQWCMGEREMWCMAENEQALKDRNLDCETYETYAAGAIKSLEKFSKRLGNEYHKYKTGRTASMESWCCKEVAQTPAPVVCGNGKTKCGETCVDTTTDSNNCGGRGNVCNTGKKCINSVCVAEQTQPVEIKEKCGTSEYLKSTKKCCDGLVIEKTSPCCGDAVCNRLYETCENCQGDCGACLPECNTPDKLVNVDPSYPCCDGSKTCTCQNQKKQKYVLSSGICVWQNEGSTNLKKTGCTDCSNGCDSQTGTCQATEGDWINIELPSVDDMINFFGYGDKDAWESEYN